MTTNTWTAELETGNSAADQEHKTLIELANRVIDASEKSDPARLRSSLLDLQTLLIAHFDREEQLMAECDYVAAAQHQEEHRQLTTEIGEQINDLAMNKGNVSFIARFMRNWLLQHIVTKDAQFGKALLAQSGTRDRRREIGNNIAIADERRLGSLEPIRWSPELELGIAGIDANHHEMIDTLNSILEARQSSDRTMLAARLEQLGNETVAHFQAEEALMSQLSMEDLSMHQEEHRQLLDEFANQVDDWRENRASAEFLCRFMYRWLLHHIATLDVPLGEAIKRKNLA